MPNSEWLFILTEYTALISTAISGTIVAIERRLDMIGVWFLALVSSFGGGVLRDVLLGDVPPRFFTNYHWLLVVTLVSMAVFCLARFWRGWWKASIRTYTEQINNILDAVGLAAFTLSGVQLACAAGYAENPFLCVFMGTITGIGGGVLRDISVMQTPRVLRKRVYAVASIIGGILYWAMMHFGISDELAWTVSMVVIIGIRVCATVFRWNMPSVPIPEDQTEQEKEMVKK
jgi:uncharacterized membrane protein YeiH